ncbi:MAG TPA: phage tail protein [Pseudonocardiaceae bacterium]|jgi:phage tail-like protein|nr:phage tail protein [Pseudonocardiaceae bacterium]
MPALLSPSQVAQGAVSVVGGALSSATATGTAQRAPENLGMAMRFAVTLDGDQMSLGDWSSCQGLAVTFNHETYDEGGFYEHPRLFPGRVAYGDVTLERAITNDSWRVVQGWLTDVQNNWINGDATRYSGNTAVITLYGSSVSEGRIAKIAWWTLRDVLPVSWTGPTLSARSNEVAVEKLTIRHQGFLG